MKWSSGFGITDISLISYCWQIFWQIAKCIKKKKVLGVPGWFSRLSVLLLILAQAMISGSSPMSGLPKHGAYDSMRFIFSLSLCLSATTTKRSSLWRSQTILGLLRVTPSFLEWMPCGQDGWKPEDSPCRVLCFWRNTLIMKAVSKQVRNIIIFINKSNLLERHWHRGCWDPWLT